MENDWLSRERQQEMIAPDRNAIVSLNPRGELIRGDISVTWQAWHSDYQMQHVAGKAERCSLQQRNRAF